jgi:polar amino acid transport system substrate-binding protein
MNRFLAASLLALLPIFAAEAHAAPDDTVVMGTGEDYPPFSWQTHDKKYTGFLRDLSQGVAKAAGFTIETKIGDWNGVKQWLRDGTVDFIDGMFYSEERDREFDFSEPHSIVTHTIFVWGEEKNIRSLTDLRGRSVLAQRGDIMHEFILKEKTGVNLILTRTQREAIDLLSYHRAQAALVARWAALYYIKELGITNVKEVGKPLEPLEFCFAVKEGNSALLEKLNRGLAAIKASGEYERIRKRWLAPLEPGRAIDIVEALPYLLVPAVLMASAIGMLWLWNWSLQEQVRVQTESLRIANEKLRQMDKIKSEVVDTVAHEVRAPLGVMQGYLDFLIDSTTGALSPKQQEVTAKIQKTIDRMNRLVGDFLDLSRLSQGRLELHKRKIDCADVAKDIGGFFEEQFRLKDLRFEQHLEPPSIILDADRDRVEQCLINLIGNSIKYTPYGGTIHFSVKELDGEVSFEIRDTGRGVPKEKIDQIFEKFGPTTPDARRSYGLGLAITKGLVELHGGRIGVLSEEGRGSAFYFTIPKISS